MCNSDSISESAYKELVSVTLAQIVLFNRRRPQEVENIRVEDYKAQTTSKKAVHDEIMQSLTVPEKLSLQRQTLLVVRGKRGRGVPIYCHQISSRAQISLPNTMSKEFLFSRTGATSSTPLRAYQVVAELADAAQPKLQNPSTIRCTKLRKHLATLSQLLDLKKSELEQLANHMGNTPRILSPPSGNHTAG